MPNQSNWISFLDGGLRRASPHRIRWRVPITRRTRRRQQAQEETDRVHAEEERVQSFVQHCFHVESSCAAAQRHARCCHSEQRGAVKAPEFPMDLRTKQEQTGCSLSSLTRGPGGAANRRAAASALLPGIVSSRHGGRANLYHPPQLRQGKMGVIAETLASGAIRRRLVRRPARRAGAISRSPSQSRRSLYGGRRDRCGGARDCPAVRRAVEAAGHRREQGRCRRLARGRLRRQVNARRLHAAVFPIPRRS